MNSLNVPQVQIADKKNISDQTSICLRDWGLLASWGSFDGSPEALVLRAGKGGGEVHLGAVSQFYFLSYEKKTMKLAIHRMPLSTILF